MIGLMVEERGREIWIERHFVQGVFIYIPF